MKRTISTAAKKYHCGDEMVLHATSVKGTEHRAGAVFKERKGYTVVCQGNQQERSPPTVVVHTYAWAKRLLWKHLNGGRW